MENKVLRSGIRHTVEILNPVQAGNITTRVSRC